MEIKESLKNLPKQPGIYFMKNSLGTIIYVGKAKNLKARVSQYFRKNSNNSPKVNEMIEQINSFEYTLTDTELEALLLECKKIKELKPRYNRLLKNCKGYKYIKLSVNEDYSRISIETQQKKDKSLYFGPFTSQSSVESSIDFIKDYYKIRKCNTKTLDNDSSGCLNFSIGNCLGPCRGNDIRDQYRKQINNIIQLLEGKDTIPLKELSYKMKLAAEEMDFEKAAKYRDQIKGIRHVINKLKIIKISRYGRNILAAEKFRDVGIKLFLIKGNKLLHNDFIEFSDYNGTLEEKLKDLIITWFKDTGTEKEGYLSQEDIDEAQIIYSYIKNKNNGIRKFNIPKSRIHSLNYEKVTAFLLGE